MSADSAAPPRRWCAEAEKRNSCDIIEEMPSPIGHALGGIAVGALVARGCGWRVAAVCAAAAALPDMDFLLPLQHRGPSHSLGAAIMAFGISLGILSSRGRPRDRLRISAAIGLACASHALLDWLGADSSSPRGVMALWPASTAFYVSGLDVFNAVDRRYWLPGFWTRNALTLLRELVILVPLALISVSAGGRGRSCRQPGGVPPPA